MWKPLVWSFLSPLFDSAGDFSAGQLRTGMEYIFPEPAAFSGSDWMKSLKVYFAHNCALRDPDPANSKEFPTKF